MSAILKVLRRTHNGLTPAQMAHNLQEAVQKKRKWAQRLDTNKKVFDDAAPKTSKIGESVVVEGVQRRTSARLYMKMGLKHKNIDFEQFHRGLNLERTTDDVKGDVKKAAHKAAENLGEVPDHYNRLSDVEESMAHTPLAEVSTALMKDYVKSATASSAQASASGDTKKAGKRFRGVHRAMVRMGVRKAKWTGDANGMVRKEEIELLEKDKKKKNKSTDTRDADRKDVDHTYPYQADESVQITEKIHPKEDWHKNDPDELLRHIYWLHGKNPPTDPQVRNAAYKGLVRQLHTKNPAPNKQTLDKHMNHYKKVNKKALGEEIAAIVEGNKANKEKKNDVVTTRGEASLAQMKKRFPGSSHLKPLGKNKDALKRIGRAAMKPRVDEEIVQEYNDRAQHALMKKDANSNKHSQLAQDAEHQQDWASAAKHWKNAGIASTVGDKVRGTSRNVSLQSRGKAIRNTLRQRTQMESIGEDWTPRRTAMKAYLAPHLSKELMAAKERKKIRDAGTIASAKAEYEKVTKPEDPKAKHKDRKFSGWEDQEANESVKKQEGSEYSTLAAKASKLSKHAMRLSSNDHREGENAHDDAESAHYSAAEKAPSARLKKHHEDRADRHAARSETHAYEKFNDALGRKGKDRKWGFDESVNSLVEKHFHLKTPSGTRIPRRRPSNMPMRAAHAVERTGPGFTSKKKGLEVASVAAISEAITGWMDKYKEEQNRNQD